MTSTGRGLARPKPNRDVTSRSAVSPTRSRSSPVAAFVRAIAVSTSWS
jgi:hypothetical protein